MSVYNALNEMCSKKNISMIRKGFTEDENKFLYTWVKRQNPTSVPIK
jgi:hypothetical protein